MGCKYNTETGGGYGSGKINSYIVGCKLSLVVKNFQVASKLIVT